MTPTMEEVAGWLREAANQQTIIARTYHKLGWSEHSHDAETLGEYFNDRADQVEAMNTPKTCDTCESYREYYEQVTNYNRLTNTCADGYVHSKGPKFGCIHHKSTPVKK